MAAVRICAEHTELSVRRQVSVRFNTNLERDAIDSIASDLAPLFEPCEDVPSHRIGLYLTSPDAGIATSVTFWSEARRTGLGLANPELFPWCLANAPAAALARRFGITGPNYSLLGEAAALQAALDLASDDLLTARVDAAIVIALEMQSGRCSGLRLASPSS